jgi:hypothetical protein
MGVSCSCQDIKLKEGSFDVHLASLNANLALSPDCRGTRSVQYDNISRNLGINSRIRWTWRPGNDVFLVVNNGWRYDDGDFQRANTGVIVKVGSTFGF